MDRIRQQLTHISKQLHVLSTSQRIAIGLCGALLVLSVFWLIQWSSSIEYVPLAGRSLTYEELDAAEVALHDAGIPYKLRGRTILVRSDDRDSVPRVLHSSNVISQADLMDMESLARDSNPFRAPKEREFNEIYAKGNTIARIIETSDVVESARVLINPATKRRIGGPNSVPTATVSVKLSPGRDMTTAVVESLARQVAGAVSGLEVYSVYITDARTGRSYSVPHPDDADYAGYLAKYKDHERHLLSKILERFSADIPGLRASVSVDLDLNRTSRTTHRWDSPQPKTESRSETQSGSSPTPAEPGVHANTGTALTAGGGAQTSSTTDETTEYFPVQPTEVETVESRAPVVRSATATVGVPRSYIVSLFRLKNPDAESPSDSDIAAEQKAELSRITAGVARIIGQPTEAVKVDVYPDLEFAATGTSWSQVPGGIGGMEADEGQLTAATDLLDAYGAPFGLGFLALVSLFMMSRIIRKSEALIPDHLPDSPDAEGVGVLNVPGATVGEAVTSEGYLTGHEVDDETLRQQQLSEEVSRMVEEDPASAADLIGRWIEEVQV